MGAYAPAMHTVAVLALDDVIPFDMAAPVDTFGWARLPDGREAYRVRVCSAAGDGVVKAGPRPPIWRPATRESPSTRTSSTSTTGSS